MSIQIRRIDLYELVWTDITTSITDNLRISTYRLLKICDENMIPVPSRDYSTLDMLETMKRPSLTRLTDMGNLPDTNIIV